VMLDDDVLPEPLTVPGRKTPRKDLLALEWLTHNRIGAYASSTAAGCNTRRYHGLLVAATQPPMGRIVALAQVAEQVLVGTERHDLATIEFPDTVRPDSTTRLVEFRNDVAATFVFDVGGLEVTKEIVLAESANTVSIRYTVRGADAALRLTPFVALRDFHHLRTFRHDHQMVFHTHGAGAVVQDRSGPLPPLYLFAPAGRFENNPQWWYRFHYRADLARGQEGFEDLYAPGEFLLDLPDGQGCQFVASLGEPRTLGFDETVSHRRRRLAGIVRGLGPERDDLSRRLAVASDAFVVQRHFPGASAAWTILAGYPWFADWGRDTFIALPGLLLSTGQFDRARDVFRTFAAHVSEGMVPNRFDDYSAAAHYNSIDASLWFIVAAERYLQATGDTHFWLAELLPAARAILRAYQNGTRFDIHADADGLLLGGSARTQLTWMDVSLADEPITPRHGKCVEVNALWHCVHRIVAERTAGTDDALAEHCRVQAALIASAFNRVFWNDSAGCLYDCVTDGTGDASLRPNQIFAVSLPHSPLPPPQQAAVVQVVQDHLLTPRGLRTLSPDDPRYRRRYGGSWESRDRAYHQGTVWAWLMGPFIEAYLRVHRARPFALAQASEWLSAFEPHLAEAGLGTVSEIFDGDAPHTPRGCVAQAWSVGELLRAKRLLDAAPADAGT